jgi:transposase
MQADRVETGKIRQNISRRGDRLMTMHLEERGSDAELANVFVAIEVSKQTWLVAGYTPSDGRTARHKIRGGDVETLLSIIARLCQKERRATGRSVRTICCHEAGYQGFWLHRRLAAVGIESYLIDATSLQVNRRARRAKTDAIDVEALLRTIIAYCRGERTICRMVRVPSIADEDAKRTHRERKRLVKERTGHINRIKALLALHGISTYEPTKADRRQRLQEVVTSDGQRLPPRLHREISREIDRLELVLDHLAEVEAERDELPYDVAACNGNAAMIKQLMSLKGIGPETATILGRELFYRDFANRKAVAGYAGLTPSPYMSGALRRDQGISKAGNAFVRTAMIELAWLWLRHQPDSALSQWFRERVGTTKGRLRRIAIVALARKLLVALWRFVSTGLIPTGAALKSA